MAQLGPILIEISPGELIDRITILEIKARRITDPGKLAVVRCQLDELRRVRMSTMGPRNPLAEDDLVFEALEGDLRTVNTFLWDLEDKVRKLSSGVDSDEHAALAFAGAALKIHELNDQRHSLKVQIDEVLGSRLREVKSYG